VLGVIELFLRRRERLAETGGEDRFLDIPNYAEIARNVDGIHSLLDVGCGEGFFLREVNASRRVGVEYDLARLHAARRERPDLLLVCADAGALPFRDAAFDGVSLIGVLPYVDPEQALEEAARVVTPAGRLAVSAASSHRLYRWIDIYRLRHPARTYALDELCALVQRAGFEVEHAYQRGLFLAPLLSTLYAIPARLDKRVGTDRTNMGRWARLARALTNPLIRLEYELVPGPGYQSFIKGSRRD
jgi:SAM-dependent methyltransferase